MEKFSKQFNVDLASFQLEKHFYPEPTGGNPALLIVVLVILIAFLLQLLLIVFLFPFSPKTSLRIWQDNLTKAWNRWVNEWDKENSVKVIQSLTVADLITSAIQGKFLQRQYIQFILKTEKTPSRD
jgi:hypothetical protein